MTSLEIGEDPKLKSLITQSRRPTSGDHHRYYVEHTCIYVQPYMQHDFNKIILNELIYCQYVYGTP